MARLKLARRLTFRLRDGSIIGVNPAVGSTRRFPKSLFILMLNIDQWVDWKTVENELVAIADDRERATGAMTALIDEGFLLEEGSDLAAADELFDTTWPFGETTTDHHLVSRALRFSDDRSEAVAFGRMLADHQYDDLAPEAEYSAKTIAMPHQLSPELEMILSKRRSRRDFTPAPIGLNDLGTILWAGAGVQEFREVPGRPRLPLTYAPSAGGLNGVDLYVIVRNVAGVAPGVYRYRAVSSALETLDLGEVEEVKFLIGNQRWAASAAVLIFIVGDASRTAWKYSSASGFNAMLIQAGHVGQNLLLAASDQSLGAVPSNALHAVEVERVLNLALGGQIVLSCVAVGQIEGESSSYEEYLPSDLAVLRKMSER